MELKMNWMLVLLMFSSIGSSFSAVYFKFVSRLPREDYLDSRDASPYRGLLLSYTPEKKYELCRDLLSERFTNRVRMNSEQLGRHPLITDDESKTQADHSEFSVIVGTITGFGIHSPKGKREDLFVKCVGKNFSLQPQEYFVKIFSSAFYPGLMYDITEDMTFNSSMRMVLTQYIGLSPKHDFSDRKKLETQYAIVRQRIETLRGESPKYVQLIESNDPFSRLTLWQKFLLCSSVVWSPIFETSRSKFTLDWSTYRDSAAQKDIQKRLTFTDTTYSARGWTADCIYCASSAGEVTNPSSPSKRLLLTRAYENSYAMYALIETARFTGLSGYFNNVPILTNAHQPITDDPPHDFRRH